MSPSYWASKHSLIWTGGKCHLSLIVATEESTTAKAGGEVCNSSNHGPFIYPAIVCATLASEAAFGSKEGIEVQEG